MAREADRFMYIADFGLVILAAFGADAIFRVLPSANLASANRILRSISIVCEAALTYPVTLGRDPSAWLSLSPLSEIWPNRRRLGVRSGSGPVSYKSRPHAFGVTLRSTPRVSQAWHSLE